MTKKQLKSQADDEEAVDRASHINFKIKPSKVTKQQALTTKYLVPSRPLPSY